MGPDRPLGVAGVVGQPALGASSVLGWEVGYRKKLNRRVSLDITAFRHRYSRLAAVEPQEIYLEEIAGAVRAIIPGEFQDNFTGRSVGVETLLEWKPAEPMRLSASHSLLSLSTYRDGARGGGAATADGRQPPSRAVLDGATPRHQGQFRAWLDLPRGWEWDSAFYAVGALPDPHVAGYGRIDTRLGWRGRGGLDISFVVQNLLDRRHIEFLSEDLRLPVERKRSGYAKITWSF
jgi:iron complex outermembrane receptor protein